MTIFQEMEEKGFLNFLLKCSANDDTAADNGQEKIIIRLFGSLPGFHRESEVYFMKMLSGKGITTPVYCR